MKTADEIYNDFAYFNKCLKEFTEIEKDLVIQLMKEYASQGNLKDELIIKKNIFLAGFKSCENGWNIQKAEKWFEKTYLNPPK
jgi:hypothetical protein